MSGLTDVFWAMACGTTSPGYRVIPVEGRTDYEVIPVIQGGTKGLDTGKGEKLSYVQASSQSVDACLFLALALSVAHLQW